MTASPSFAAWLRGGPLEIDDLLGTGNGRTRASIVYLSHLSDTERQFVVTLLLSKVVTWMRKQPGTSELRALGYTGADALPEGAGGDERLCMEGCVWRGE